VHGALRQCFLHAATYWKDTQMTRELQPGTAISIALGPITHFGIYLGAGRVIENSKLAGCVRELSLEQFAGGRTFYIDQTASRYSPCEVVARAKSLLGRPYSLLRSNCEHFKNEVLRGRPYSRQVVVGLAAVAIWLFSRSGN